MIKAKSVVGDLEWWSRKTTDVVEAAPFYTEVRIAWSYDYTRFYQFNVATGHYIATPYAATTPADIEHPRIGTDSNGDPIYGTVHRPPGAIATFSGAGETTLNRADLRNYLRPDLTLDTSGIDSGSFLAFLRCVNSTGPVQPGFCPTLQIPTFAWSFTTPLNKSGTPIATGPEAPVPGYLAPEFDLGLIVGFQVPFQAIDDNLTIVGAHGEAYANFPRVLSAGDTPLQLTDFPPEHWRDLSGSYFFTVTDAYGARGTYTILIG